MADAHSRATVLVIEDDETTRETFREMLLAEGYTVRVEANADDGFAWASAQIPDVILLDLHMPIAGGLECLRRLRANPVCAGIPVAIVTGDYFVDEQIAEQLQERGATIYFKPVWEEDLHRIVRKLLASVAAGQRR
jgi:CheY-like chemotaxis protein